MSAVPATVPATTTGWFTNPFASDKKEQGTPEQGPPAPESAPSAVGGRRKKQRGGSFHPYTPSSDLSSTASAFKGGRRRRTRKSRKTYRKKSHRKSHRKRR